MKIIRYFLIISVLQFMWTSSVTATLISVDLYSSHDGLITRDTDTGLEWLDLTSTVNYSYNDMLTELGSGGAFEGFRYATVADIDNLQLSAGLPSGLFSSASTYFYRTEFATLMDLVGITNSTSTYEYSYGLTGDPFEPSTLTDDRIMRGFAMSAFAVRAQQGVVGDSIASASIGSWLIRDTVSVPEPTSLVLLLFGLMGLGLVKRGNWKSANRVSF